MIDIFDCPFDGIDNKLRTDLGFKVTSHNLEIYGLCKNCLNEIPS
jgi:Fe2+ or Zn2+ uptake regulation protein